MSKFLYAVASIALVLNLASCGIGAYHNPKGSPESLARIKNHDKTQHWNPTIFADDEKVMVYSVDGLPVSYDTSWTIGAKNIMLEPGMRKMEVLVSSNKSTVYRRSIVSVVLNAKAGKTYLLKGSYKDTDARIWIEEESTGKIVVPVRNVEILAVLPRAQVPMMIFLPAN